MWKHIIDLARQILALKRDTQQNTLDIRVTEEGLNEVRREVRAAQADVRDLRQEVNQLRVDLVQLIRVVERLTMEIERERAEARHAHETTLLRLENTLIRHGMQLTGRADEPQDA
jgi:predicted RNase H-like nuclease (RuvC/YqgF family)